MTPRDVECQREVSVHIVNLPTVSEITCAGTDTAGIEMPAEEGSCVPLRTIELAKWIKRQ